MYYSFHDVGTITVTLCRLKIKDDPSGFQALGREATGYFYDLYDFQYSGGTYSFGTHAARDRAASQA